LPEVEQTEETGTEKVAVRKRKTPTKAKTQECGEM